MTRTSAGATNGWLRDERATLAAEQILNAAGALFAERGVAAVGMLDVASAAGCSRATLYRYYENRDALRAAFVHRETRRIGAAVAHEVAGVTDARERLTRAIVSSLRLVRDDPSLAGWFTPGDTGVAARLARSSAVIEGLVVTFLGGGTDPEARRRARWVVHVLVSLLAHPEDDADDERALIREFVAPAVVGEG